MCFSLCGVTVENNLSGKAKTWALVTFLVVESVGFHGERTARNSVGLGIQQTWFGRPSLHLLFLWLWARCLERASVPPAEDGPDSP